MAESGPQIERQDAKPAKNAKVRNIQREPIWGAALLRRSSR